MGEKVGFVKEIRRDHIVVAGTASFANGDGLCYVAGAQGRDELVGFRVNRAEGNHLYPHKMPQGLKDGTVVYRNQDQQMESVLAGQTSRRLLPLSWLLEETQTGFRLTARQGERTAYQDFECEHQEARTDQTASIRDVLSKLGGTIYETMDTEIAFSGPWFIPRSRLAEWRREVLTMLERQSMVEPHSSYSLTSDKVLSGLGRPEALNISTSPLMTCRYCIRYQLGQCMKCNPDAVRGPLYLRGADGRRFLLRFDCKACQMMVELED